MIYQGDCLEILPTLEAESVQCCVTSPPYWGLRDYGCEGQLGLEGTPAAYVENLVAVFREVRRVLRADGVVFLNLGDSYAGSSSGGFRPGAGRADGIVDDRNQRNRNGNGCPENLKPKDLIGIPWRVAFALQSDGWYLRQDIIWCLSGGTLVYARTQKGEMPMTIKDMARLDPATVQLWNGERWTQLLGISRKARQGTELEIVLRSGERIACTPTHRFPTSRGLLEAKDLCIGDVLQSCSLPEPETAKDCAIDEDAAWFAGLYVAEGSMAGDTIQISGHSKEQTRWERVKAIAAKYGGTATVTVNGNGMNIRVYGKVLNAILGELVTGRTAKTKAFAPVVWRYSNKFIAAMVDGYLSGDGCADGNRWRIGFCRNYNLERDLRTACARLGYKLTLNLSSTQYDGRRVPTFRGEIRTQTSGHWNEKERGEIVEIRKARGRYVYDIGVQDEPHLFALASGILTHNSKPNPMPESVTDRCTKAHEYVFLLTRSERYYYDAEAVSERSSEKDWASRYDRYSEDHKREPTDEVNGIRSRKKQAVPTGRDTEKRSHGTIHKDGRRKHPIGGVKYGDSDAEETRTKSGNDWEPTQKRNRRSVWTISTEGFPEAHFATFPTKIPKLCILAGTKPGDTVLDPFTGSGTTGMVAHQLGREFVGIELNPEYVALAEKRIAPAKAQGLLAETLGVAEGSRVAG